MMLVCLLNTDLNRTFEPADVTVNMKMVCSFGEMYKRHSDRFNLLSDDRRESIPNLIDHFTETFQDLKLKILSLIVN